MSTYILEGSQKMVRICYLLGMISGLNSGWCYWHVWKMSKSFHPIAAPTYWRRIESSSWDHHKKQPWGCFAPSSPCDGYQLCRKRYVHMSNISAHCTVPVGIVPRWESHLRVGAHGMGAHLSLASYCHVSSGNMQHGSESQEKFNVFFDLLIS